MASKLKLTELLYPTSTTPAITINPDNTVTFGASTTTITNLAYTGTLTGGTGVINIGSGQLVKDTAGNLGLGVTPSAWGSGFRAFELAAGSSLLSTGSSNIRMAQNAYYNGTNWIYSSTAAASRFDTTGGLFQWHIAPSGTAGNAISFTQAMTLDASGNLGVGTSSPYSASGVKTIQLTGSDYSLFEQSVTTATAGYQNWRQIVRGSVGGHVYQLQLMNDANSAEQTIYEVSRTANSVNYQRWFGGTSEAMRLTSSGRLLIGTTSGGGTTPQYPLSLGVGLGRKLAVYDDGSSAGVASGFGIDMGGSSYELSAWVGSSGGGNGTFTWGQVNTTSNTFSEKMRLDSSGNLLVGETSGGSTIGAGIVKARGYNVRPGYSTAFNSSVFNIDWTGSPQLWIDNTNVGTLATTSDYRIKKNITTQTAPALERVMQLRPVNYELADYGTLFKADGVAREGFIAHELAAVIPSAVDGEKDAQDQIQSLRLDALCSVLTKAIQELKAEFDAYKASHP